MQDCHWTAQEIVDKINSNEKGAASGMLQSEMNKMRDNPEEFRRLVKEMVRLTKDDGNDWNDVVFKLDDKGNVRSVSVNDSYFLNTLLAREGRPLPLGFVASINHDCTISK